MGFLNKIKNVFFEEDSDDEEFEQKKGVKINDHRGEDAIVKKIEPIKPLEQEKEEIVEEKKPQPVIYDDDDFFEEEVVYHKEESNLYSGPKYKEEQKAKFKASPVISPVFGLVNNEKPKEDETKSLDHLFSEDIKKKITVDTVRQKAYGDTDTLENIIINEMEESSDIYDTKEDKGPVIEKVTLGDAEEYFQDLGLEYNVDYTDAKKEKAKTRVAKNKELSIKVMDETEKDKDEKEEADEKNLYDLIDMMYKEKE